MSSCHPVCTATRCTLLVCVASPGFCRAINSWVQRHLIVRAGRRCQESSRARCVSRCAMPQSYPYQMPHACMPCHNLPILYPGRRGRRAHCRCLLQLPPSWPSRTSLPPPPPSPLPSPPPSLPPSQRQRLLPSEPPPSPSGPHRCRPRRLESEPPPPPPPSLSPLFRRCELRPSELSPSPPPSRARDSPSPPPSLVAHAAASWQRRTFG